MPTTRFAFDTYDSFLPTFGCPGPFHSSEAPALDGHSVWGVTTWNYAAADPSVDPLVTAHVTEWRASLGLEIPVWQKFVLASLVQYRCDQSNVAAFVMHDLSRDGRAVDQILKASP